MGLSVAEREFLRKRVKILTPHMKKSELVQHFSMEGFRPRTIYNAINRLQMGQPIQDKKRTGRSTSWTAAENKKLAELVNNRTGVSQRGLGLKFDRNQRTIGRQLSKLSISYRKREKVPKYSAEQAQRSSELSGKLANNLYRTSCSVIVDDEKYFTLRGDNMPGNSGYYTTDKSACPDNVRFVGKEKFPKKILVWIAISNRGLSKPLIRPTRSEAINSEIYVKECLTKRLVPFIREYHSDLNYVFWPDLASSHYSKDTVAWMDKNVTYVDKRLNPANVPQARPIENFWGCLAQKVYEGGWQATTEEELIRRIKRKLKEFDLKSVESLMRGVKAKLKSMATKGVLASYKN